MYELIDVKRDWAYSAWLRSALFDSAGEEAGEEAADGPLKSGSGAAVAWAYM